MSAKKTHKPIHVPVKPGAKPKPKPPAVVPKVTAAPETLNIYLRVHFSLPNEPGKPAWPRKTRWKLDHPIQKATITVFENKKTGEEQPGKEKRKPIFVTTDAKGGCHAAHR